MQNIFPSPKIISMHHTSKEDWNFSVCISKTIRGHNSFRGNDWSSDDDLPKIPIQERIMSDLFLQYYKRLHHG